MSEESFWSNFVLFIKVRWFNFKDFIKTFLFFWLRHPYFALIDISVLLYYFFSSPYHIVRNFTSGKEPYGETPLVVMKALTQCVPITAADTVYELGFGRGRVCFYLASIIECKSVGIEIIPEFVQRAEKIKNFFNVKRLTLYQADLLSHDMSDATVIYLFGTCLADEQIMHFIDRCKTLKKGTKIITISYSLPEYKEVAYIHLIDHQEVRFAWGKTEAYIHELI